MGGLVELLGIEGGAESEGDTGAEENVVGESSDTTVVDLDLFIPCIRNGSSMAKSGICRAYLGERDRVQSVLAGNLKSNGIPAL